MWYQRQKCRTHHGLHSALKKRINQKTPYVVRSGRIKKKLTIVETAPQVGLSEERKEYASNNANQRRANKLWIGLVGSHGIGPVVFGDTPPEDVDHDHGQEGKQRFE